MMFAKLKAWAAEVWQFVKYAMTSEGVKRWISIAQDLDRKLKDALNREERYKDQIERCKALVEARDKNIAGLEAECRRLHDLARERFQETESLKASCNGLEQDAAILVQRQKEDAAKIKDLAASVRVLAAERDKHMRAAAEWQGQCKRMSEAMRALRHVIEVVTDGKHPEQWFAMTLDEILKSPPGNTSATASPRTGDLAEMNRDRLEVATLEDGLGAHRVGVAWAEGLSPRTIAEVMKDSKTVGVESTISGDGDIVNVGHSLNGKPPLTCPSCGARVGSYTTNRETGVSLCEHCQGIADEINAAIAEIDKGRVSPEQLADEARRYQQAACSIPEKPDVVIAHLSEQVVDLTNRLEAMGKFRNVAVETIDILTTERDGYRASLERLSQEKGA